MKTYINLLVAVLTAAILGGCKMTREIEVTKTAAPEQFRNAKTTDTLTIASLAFDEFFKDKELKNLIDTALINNFDMQIALKNIASAGQIFKQARLGNVPQINFQITGVTNRLSDNSLNGLSTNQFLKTNHVEDFNASFNLTWEADIWGKIKNQQQVALSGYLQTEEARKAIQTQLISAIAQGYYRLLMIDAQLAIAEKNLALNDSTLRIVNLQFDAGQVSALAVQQVQAQQLVAAQLIPKLKQDLTIQENALSLLTGHEPGDINRLVNLEKTAVYEQVSVGYPSAMLSRRPDVKSAELSLAMANAKVGVAKASFYPSFNITASAGVNAFKASNWFNLPASLFGLVSAGLTQPLLQRRQIKTQYEVAKIDREKAVIEFRQSVLTAVTEVSDELVKIERLKQQYDIAANKVNVLRLAVKNADLLFRSGTATYLEVITAQSNFLQSQLELTVIKTGQLNATVELYRALGGGV